MSNIPSLPAAPESQDTVNLRKPRKKNDTPMPAKLENIVRADFQTILEEPQLERTPRQKECALATAALITTLKEFAKEGKSKEEVQDLLTEHETRYPEFRADLPDIRADSIHGGTWTVMVGLNRRTGQYEITMR